MGQKWGDLRTVCVKAWKLGQAQMFQGLKRFGVAMDGAMERGETTEGGRVGMRRPQRQLCARPHPAGDGNQGL